VQQLQKTMKDALIATDIWDRGTGLSLAGVNPQAEATALFNLLTDEIAMTLANSGFNKLGDYYILDLDADHMVVIIKYSDDLMQGTLFATDKVNMGVLFGMALPRLMRTVNAAQAAAA
jgi:hypothetical protein